MTTVSIALTLAGTAAAAEQLALVVDALPSLTDLEREALAGSLNGVKATKRAENALGRARAKLRAAA